MHGIIMNKDIMNNHKQMREQIVNLEVVKEIHYKQQEREKRVWKIHLIIRYQNRIGINQKMRI